MNIGSYTISVDGKGEVVNAILPLLDNEDGDVKPLVNTRLIKLLYSYNLTNNFDALFDDASLALMANTALWLIGENKSELKD